jgi:hypothetical protein
MENISAIQSNNFPVSAATVLVCLGVGVVVAILILVLCCYLVFRRNNQRGGAQNSFLDTPHNQDPYPYYRGSRRSLEAQFPHGMGSMHARQESHQMPQFHQMLRGGPDVQNVQNVEAVQAAVLEAMRAAHAPPPTVSLPA